MFGPRCHQLVRTNIPSKFEGPTSKHCQVIKLFSTKDPGDLDLCHQDNLLVRTNISTNFEGPNHKHCRSISFSGTKGHSDLDLWLKDHLLFRPILLISLIVLGIIIANGIFLYVKHVTTSLCVGPLFTHGRNLNTLLRGLLGNATYHITKA